MWLAALAKTGKPEAKRPYINYYLKKENLMPANAHAYVRLFSNLPTQVPFSLNSKNRRPHGLCWFADKDGKLPDVEAVWKEFFEASDEEMSFAGDTANVEKILSERKLFGIPYKNMFQADAEDENKDEVPFLEIGLGKKSSSDHLLYVIRLVPDGLLAAGRVKKDKLPDLIEDLTLFFETLPQFPVHPSRIASGKGGLCTEEDHEPSKEKELLGPWSFSTLRASSFPDLELKVAATLAAIPTPNRLWAYSWIDGFGAAVFSLVEAGGKIIEKPIMLFNVDSEIPSGLLDKKQPCRTLFFRR